MADVNVSTVASRLTGDSERPGGAAFDLIELLFFAYRDFTRDADELLARLGFGRAHHRVLHFVNRHPSMRVADLLDVLKITKQSLGRVLKQLIDKGYIVQRAGSADRRERLLYPTASGRALLKRLAAPQLVRLAEALKAMPKNGPKSPPSCPHRRSLTATGTRRRHDDDSYDQTASQQGA